MSIITVAPPLSASLIIMFSSFARDLNNFFFFFAVSINYILYFCFHLDIKECLLH